MIKTASTMLPLGTAAPDFSLPDAEGNVVWTSPEIYTSAFRMPC